uniref:C2H2-type domain-containing protein n=1 Tax=Nothobranchius furzeri TaxID=105023 RepID=A0A8C6NQD1_NOTFU
MRRRGRRRRRRTQQPWCLKQKDIIVPFVLTRLTQRRNPSPVRFSHTNASSPQSEGQNDQQAGGLEVKFEETPHEKADCCDADSNDKESDNQVSTEDSNSDEHDLGQHVCPVCGKSFSTWVALKSHKKAHAVEGLTCLACDKQFKEKEALEKHLKLHRKVEVGPRSLKCSECNKEFNRMYHLKRHLMSHRRAANADCYTCPDCHKNFFFPEDLNKHLEIHAKENSGTCPKCDATFSTAEDLESHMEVHRKTYNCSTCGKKFKVEYALKKHEQSHQNEQYYCSFCCKYFHKLSLYKRHRPFSCPHCGQTFTQTGDRNRHISKNHPLENTTNDDI